VARGRIYKRGRTWTFVVDVPPTDGQARKQFTRGGFPTKKAAQRALAELLAELARDEFVMPTRQTVGEFLTDEWLPSAELTVRPTTLASYRLQVRRYIAPRIGHVPLQQLTGAGINRLYADLRRDVGLSPASVRKVHTVLRRAFRDAVRWRRLPVNVAEAADPPPQTRVGGLGLRTWSPAQVRRFFESAGINRHGGGDGNALHRRGSDPRWPRVMR
jgi:integrase